MLLASFAERWMLLLEWYVSSLGGRVVGTNVVGEKWNRRIMVSSGGRGAVLSSEEAKKNREQKDALDSTRLRRGSTAVTLADLARLLLSSAKKSMPWLLTVALGAVRGCTRRLG